MNVQAKKLTPNQKYVYQAVEEIGNSQISDPNCKEILQKTETLKGSKISLPTIYSVLNHLQETGLINLTQHSPIKTYRVKKEKPNFDVEKTDSHKEIDPNENGIEIFVDQAIDDSAIEMMKGSCTSNEIVGYSQRKTWSHNAQNFKIANELERIKKLGFIPEETDDRTCVFRPEEEYWDNKKSSNVANNDEILVFSDRHISRHY
jgi:Fe2+ or Zn2+ uptake regulation protein